MDGWQTIVFKLDGSVSDSPLPMALAKVMSTQHPLYQFLYVAGLFGLVGSFHGLIFEVVWLFWTAPIVNL